jgi:FixJ family two-component response regulator
MKHLLWAYGYEPELYSSSEEFLDAKAKTEASCLVIDVQLGDSSGIDLARQIAETGFKLPIIFMTASDDRVIEKQAMETGCVALLRKPISAEVLIRALMKAVP